MSSTCLIDDLTLIVDDEELHCSRESLMKCSEYFKAMFCSNMKESNASSVVIKDASFHRLKWLVNYSRDNSKHKFDDVYDACDILHTACIYQFLGVIEIASKYIINRLSHKNCLSVMYIANLHALNNLYNLSRRKALWDFLLVRQTQEFFSRDKECLIDYLSCDMLNTPREELVLESAVQWLEYDLASRKEVFQEVLSCVRLEDVGSSYLKPYLVRPSVMSDENVQLSIAQAVDLELAPSKSRKIPLQLWITGEWHPNPTEAENSSKLVCVHGELDKTNKFELLDNLPINDPNPRAGGRATERAGFTVSAVGKDLYIMGGGSVSSSQLHPDCWRYDTFRGVWTEVGELPVPRRHHSAVLVGGRYLLLIGGFGPFRVQLRSVLCYDTLTGGWSEVREMTRPVFSAAVCQCQDYIYVFKNIIQRFNIRCIETDQESQWEEVRSALPFEIGLYSAISVGDKIYLLGQNICSLVCFDTRSLTFDTLVTFQPCVMRLSPVLYRKNSHQMLIVSRQKKDEEGVKTLVEEIDIKETRVLKEYDIGWTISKPQAALVPYYPNFR